jgi:hypothetical protein
MACVAIYLFAYYIFILMMLIQKETSESSKNNDVLQKKNCMKCNRNVIYLYFSEVTSALDSMSNHISLSHSGVLPSTKPLTMSRLLLMSANAKIPANSGVTRDSRYCDNARL